MTRAEALRNVQMYGLALFDTMLFLDTHPNNRQAMEFFNYTREIYREAVKAFESQFGPLSAGSSDSESWAWVNEPWPWEVEE